MHVLLDENEVAIAGAAFMVLTIFRLKSASG